jgi:hypothetical protein
MMQTPPIWRVRVPLRTTSVVMSFLIAGCGDYSAQPNAPAAINGQTNGSGEGSRQYSGSQGSRVKPTNIKTH